MLSRRYLVACGFALVIANHFYFSSIINYKVVFIGGVIFLVNRLRLKYCVYLVALLLMQTTSIALYSINFLEDMKLLLLTTMMCLGLYGWVSEGLRRGITEIKPGFLFVAASLPLFLPGARGYLSLSPLILFLFLTAAREKACSRPKGFDFVFFSIISGLIGWRSAVVAFLGAAIFNFYRYLNLYRAILLILICIISLYATYAYWLEDLLEILIASGTANDPSSGRIAMGYFAGLFLMESIVSMDWGIFFGYGIGYPSSLFAENLSVTLNILGFEVTSSKVVVGKERLHMHNFLLQTIIEFGIVGLMLYLRLVYQLFTYSRMFSVLTTIGLISGFFSGTFYFYSSFFIVLTALYYHRSRLQKSTLQAQHVE